MIELQSITKRYHDGAAAVEDLSLTIDSGEIFALGWNQNDTSENKTLVLDIQGGGAPTTLASVAYTSTEQAGVGFDANNVYVADTIPGPSIPGCGGACEYETSKVSVIAVPRSGNGSPVTLGTTSPSQTSNSGYGSSVAVDTSNVYFVANAVLTSVPLRVGATKTLAASPPVSTGEFAYDGTNIYWGSNSDSGNVIAEVATSGGDVSTLCTATGSTVIGCAVDATSLYCLMGPTGYQGGTASLVKITPK